MLIKKGYITIFLALFIYVLYNYYMIKRQYEQQNRVFNNFITYMSNIHGVDKVQSWLVYCDNVDFNMPIKKQEYMIKE